MGGTMTRRFALALAIGLAVGACSGPFAMQDAPPPPTQTPIQDAAPPSGAPTPVVTPTLTPSATPAPNASGTGVAHRGQVLFSTKAVSGTATSCQVNDQVPFNPDGMQAVSVGVPVFATYIFESTQSADPVKLSALLHGVLFGQQVTLSIPDTQGRDCYADPTDLSKLPGWGPGTYTFQAFNSDKEISQGILAVLPLP
jgi:hypothetical protein